MPSTVFFAGVILVVATFVCGETQRLGTHDDMLSYYAPSESFRSSAQAQGDSSSSSRDLSSQSNSVSGEESDDSALRNNGEYSKLQPLSSDVVDTLLTSYQKNRGTNSLSEDEYNGYNRERDNSSQDFQINSSIKEHDKRSDLGERLKFFNKNGRERYFRFFQPSSNNTPHTFQTKELKRERIGGSSLSVDSSLDLIRQRFAQELRRKHAQEKQKQIQNNDEFLSSIGKRAGPMNPTKMH